MRKSLPAFVLSFVATLILLDYWVKIPALNNGAADVRQWVSIIANVAIGLGAINLYLVHGRTVRLQRGEWYNSAALIVLMTYMIILGVAYTINAPVYQFLYNYVNVPISSTIFSTAAFQVASASYRTFRARNTEAALLLIAGIIVMLGKVPLGEMIGAWVPTLAQWIMDVWNTAAQRGIVISTAIGTLIIAYRVIVGLERGHFGSGE
jgi:hypothetical protein